MIGDRCGGHVSQVVVTPESKQGTVGVDEVALAADDAKSGERIV
jgi:hypothetical protein